MKCIRQDVTKPAAQHLKKYHTKTKSTKHVDKSKIANTKMKQHKVVQGVNCVPYFILLCVQTHSWVSGHVCVTQVHAHTYVCENIGVCVHRMSV